MNTLDEAWAWYTAARVNLRRMNRLARRYWDDLPWADRLDRDDEFRTLGANDVRAQTSTALAALDDLAVVVLFAAFERTVREHVIREVETESAGKLTHPVLTKVAEEAIEVIKRGSFAKLLVWYGSGHPSLVEEVRQVRQYRNWITHGRRGNQPPAVAPRMAHDRLSRFLRDVLQGADSP